MRKRKQEKLCTFLEAIEEERYENDEEMEEASFSRKHYQMIADMIERHLEGTPSGYKASQVLEAIADDLADIFEQDNPRFDRGKFLAAAGLKSEERDEEGEDDEEEKAKPDKEKVADDGSIEDDGEEDEKEPEEVEEAVAQLAGVDKILAALSSDPLSGLEDLLTLVGQNISRALNLGSAEKEKVETALEKMKREAEERKGERKAQKERISTLSAGDDEDVEDEEEVEDEE